MSVTKLEIQRAEALGRLAVQGTRGVSACPYEANGSPDERQLASAFVRAYVAARGVVSVDYDDGERTHHAQGVTIHVRKPSA